MTEDRRSDKRVGTNLPARWSGVAGNQEGRIEDLSLGGCFVNTTGRVDVGETVIVEIRQPCGEWLRVNGKVTAFHIGIGFGLMFSFLKEDEQQALRELII